MFQPFLITGHCHLCLKMSFSHLCQVRKQSKDSNSGNLLDNVVWLKIPRPQHLRYVCQFSIVSEHVQRPAWGAEPEALVRFVKKHARTYSALSIERSVRSEEMRSIRRRFNMTQTYCIHSQWTTTQRSITKAKGFYPSSALGNKHISSDV